MRACMWLIGRCNGATNKPLARATARPPARPNHASVEVSSWDGASWA
jgi:hypothetical protein